jgi:hypothetical protein
MDPSMTEGHVGQIPGNLSVSPSRPITHNRVPAWLEAASLAAILAVFLALALPQLDLPGLHPDEAQEVIPTVQLLRGQPVETLRDSGLTLFGQRFPLMIVDYIGTVNTYLAAPFFKLLGISVVSLRLMAVLTSAVTLVLLYRLGRALYSPAVGLTAAALLAVQPTFVFWSRQGVFVTFVTAPLTLGALLCGWRWWRGGGRRRDLYAGALLLGLALAAKLLALWVIFGVGGAFAILYAPQIWRALRERTLAPLGLSLTWPQLGLAALFFALGATMLIAYNLQTGGTWLAIRDNLATSYYGISNLAILENLAERFIGLKVVLSGEHFWYLGGVFVNPWWPWALPLAGLAALIITLWRAREEWRGLLFPHLALALMTAASIFTVSALWFTHFALLMPWPALALAVALSRVARHLRPVWLGTGLAALVVVGLVATDVRADWRYHAALRDAGGYGAHSAAVYRLTERLLAGGSPLPYALDWGIQDPVQFLSKGEVNPVELTGFEFEAGDEFAERVVESLDDPDHLYILHSREETVFERRDAFEAIVAEHGLVIADEEVITDVSGRAIFVLVRLGPENGGQ